MTPVERPGASWPSLPVLHKSDYILGAKISLTSNDYFVISSGEKNMPNLWPERVQNIISFRNAKFSATSFPTTWKNRQE
jgi:hypothetical protein